MCKWMLNKVKKSLGRNNTAAVKCRRPKRERDGRSCWEKQQCDGLFFLLCQVIKSRLLSVCDHIGLLKSLCRKFVNSHLGVLIEELTTTDDVRTICVNMKACK